MPTTRSRLKLDEETFQGLLAAAYTIQEHNEKRKRGASTATVPEPEPALKKELGAYCPQCAAPLKEGESSCQHCGSDQFRPGERMQRKFASLWEMSQEQSVHHDPESSVEAVQELEEWPAPDPPALGQAAPDPEQIRILDVEEESPSQPEDRPAETDWISRFPELADLQGPASNVDGGGGGDAEGPIGKLHSKWKHVPRADFYLGIAILIAIVAILWPTPATPQKPGLQPWQRILVKLGIAEAPPTQVHYRGNPNVQVWVDSHTALYYCAGDEQYGKSANGHFAAQREAQLEQFEPAGRAVCQ